MQGPNQGKTEPEHANTEASLGRCLVDGDTAATSGDRRTRRKAFGLSLAIEATVLALLTVAPLLTSIAQPQISRVLPPMLVDLVGWRMHDTNRNSVLRSTRPEVSLTKWDVRPQPGGRLVNPYENAEPDDASILGQSVFPSAIPITVLAVTLPNVEPPAIVHHNPQEARPVKVSEGVQQAQLISRIEPRYPPLALQIKKEGTVLFHAIISRDGHITALEVVSGPPLLVAAALDAVRQWRYRPTLLSGEPVEVETTITVTFRLQP